MINSQMPNDTKILEQESRPFSCSVKAQTIEGLVIRSVVDDQKYMFDVQAFVNSKFYTFCIVEQAEPHYLVRLVKVHDRTGTFLSLKTLHLTNKKVELLFEQVLTTLADEA
jgi:hypothetical protein